MPKEDETKRPLAAILSIVDAHRMATSSKLLSAVPMLLLAATGCVSRQSEEARQVEGQQRIHAMLELIPMPPAPTVESCSRASVTDRPAYLCLAEVHASAACARQASEDLRPYTLCLAETRGDDVEHELKEQLAAAVGRVRANIGSAGVIRLQSDQEQWESLRSRTCDAETDAAPVSEQARAQLTCYARIAEPRVAHLKTVVVTR